jgi:hypothetical protein
MIVSLYIYVDGIAKRIELFEDEKISITSSIQNVNDISKVFTDYSQSFTIPASVTNNEIFKHWYENSIDNGFDHRLRYNGYIEIDTQMFRMGRWQLEGVTLKDNYVENYKLTFYGALKSLTDKFGEDKLKDVETLNDYTLNYSGLNVQNLVKSTLDDDLMFPLISSQRVWQYGGGGSNDISQNSHHIHYYELFPALKVARIFDAIETKYDITLNGDFLSDERFTKAFLWLKNNEASSLIPKTEPQLLTLIDETTDYFIIADNTLTVTNYTNPDQTDPRFTILFNFTATTDSYLTVYKDGQFYTSVNGSGNTLFFNPLFGLLSGDYQFFIRTELPTAYTATQVGTYYDIPTSSTITMFTNIHSDNLVNLLDLPALAPDIKVSDFFSGILKMFNLTCFSENGIDFQVEQLEDWYNSGTLEDLSEYVITENIEITGVKTYKKIEFKYQKCESLLNRNFYDTNSREYGDLSYSFDNDGTEYKVELPFENIMFNKFTDTNLQVGYALKTDLNQYLPKPIILYKYENAECDFYLNNGTSTVKITDYNVFGQDVLNVDTNHSLNWGVENSSYLEAPIENSLFYDYYLSYLNNIYTIKARLIKLKMRLPYEKIIKLKLNDRVVIRDKRYLINQFTTDLTTFEVDFELIQDFREI